MGRAAQYIWTSLSHMDLTCSFYSLPITMSSSCSSPRAQSPRGSEMASEPTPPRNFPEAIQGYLAASGPLQASLERFSVVQESRWPIYASYVLEANLMVGLFDNKHEADIIFRGFTFPQQHTLRIYLDQSKRWVELPLISAQSFECRGLSVQIPHGCLRPVRRVGTTHGPPTASSARRPW